MRLNRLDLIRYGRFQDKVLDFGAPPERGPDVTLVYGANEAGKSTAFTAWLDFLFGFRGAPQYAYRFDPREKRVGAVLDTPDGVQTLRRSAATAGSLTDANGHVISEQRLAAWLFGLDREAYANRFSLNDAILRNGGAEIARAQGDLGQLLHAGSSGLAGLSEALAKVEAEVEAFHKKGGRKTAANEGRNRLRELDLELRDLRLDPKSFDRLLKARDDAEAGFAAADAALVEAKRAQRLREAADARRSVAREIEDLSAWLDGAPGGPELPPDAVTGAAAAASKRADAEERAAKAQAAAQAAAARLAALDGDPDGHSVAALLEALETAVFDEGEPLLPRVQTAHADLAKRREERRGLLARMDALADGLAGPGHGPAAMVPSRGLIAELRRLADAVRTARATLGGERRARREAEADLGPAVEPPQGLDRLEDALRAWDRLPDSLDAVLRAAAAGEAALAALTAGLPPDWRAIAEAGLPEVAEIEAVADAAQAAEGRRDALAALSRDAAQDWHAARSAHDAAAARPDMMRDQEAAASRARRDAAWSVHRAALAPASADRFEQAMREDDAAQARHAATAEVRLRLAQLAEEATRRQSLRDQRAQALEAAEATAGAAAAGVAAMATRLGLPAATPPRALRQRRDRLEAALGAARDAEAARAAASALGDERALRLAALRAALGGDAPDARLPALAERALQEQRRQQAAADAWREARRSIARMQRSEALAAQALADHEAALAARIAGLWCAGLDADGVLTALPALEDLAALDAEARQLGQRIRAMEAAIETFEPQGRKLSALLGLSDAAPATDILAAARRRAAEAAEAARTIAAEKAALAAAEAGLRDAAVERAAQDRELARILAGQAVAADADPVAAVTLLSRRDMLRDRLARAEADRAAAGRGLDPEALAAEEADPDPLRTEALAEAVHAAGALRDAAIERRSQARTALDAALAGEGGAAPDQERAALIEALRQQGREAVARHFGLLAARSALRRFRQSHRGAMLEATEQAFAHITGGEWPRLDTQTQGATERLVGVRGEEPVAVSAMSTGTQGQLYLALRIAGHAAFVAAHGPLPFITDDIHETFDDDRARAAFELAAAMGARGQAILFTHHRHLVDLARDAIPDVRVLALG